MAEKAVVFRNPEVVKAGEDIAKVAGILNLSRILRSENGDVADGVKIEELVRCTFDDLAAEDNEHF